MITEVQNATGTVKHCASEEGFDLNRAALDFRGFHRFYGRLSDRPELREIFKRYASRCAVTWTLEDLYRFLTQEQKEWEGTSDVGQDLSTTCGWLVSTFEPLEENKALNLLSFPGTFSYFLHFFKFEILSSFDGFARPVKSM